MRSGNLFFIDWHNLNVSEIIAQKSEIFDQKDKSEHVQVTSQNLLSGKKAWSHKNYDFLTLKN